VSRRLSDDPWRRKIEFLVERKFGNPRRLQGSELEKAHAYGNELRQMPPEGLDALFIAEQAEKRKEGELYEQSIFPHLLDFSRWGRMPQWALAEAVALSLGRSPDVVSPEYVEQYANFPEDAGLSAFVRRFMEVWDLVVRARKVDQLSDPTQPIEFLEWAKLHDVDYPPELEQQVCAQLRRREDASRKQTANGRPPTGPDSAGGVGTKDPRSAKSSAAAGPACQKWLENLMKAGSKEKPKGDYLDEARSLFKSLSARQFRSAWRGAVAETRDPHNWTKPGRRKREKS